MVLDFLQAVTGLMSAGVAIQNKKAAELEAAEKEKELRHKLIGYNLELTAKYTYKYGVDWVKSHWNWTEEQIEANEKSIFKFIDDLI